MIPFDENGCIIWPGKTAKDGYGHVTVNRVDRMAHRISYESHVGPIPPSLVIDHLCRNRSCVNPDHLEAVTPGENFRRGLYGVLRTHCRHGHELAGDNLASRGGGRNRVCRTCERRRALTSYHKHKRLKRDKG